MREEMEVAEIVERKIQGRAAQFFVFRYRMADDHWAAGDWILGLAGPFVEGQAPFSGSSGGFSRCNDVEGSITPGELVDWFIGIVESKSGTRLTEPADDEQDAQRDQSP